MKKVAAITRSGSIPIIAAASRSKETARIAFPSRVHCTSPIRASIRMNAPTMTMTPRYWMKTPLSPPRWMPL